MDEIIVKWILEFLMRQKINDNVINDVISSLQFNHHDYRLKKTILLRSIQSEISDGSVSENLLELIGTIEALDHGEGKPASELMREAYCLVAVDCTVRFLEETEEENAKYVEAVERVWRRKVCVSEGLCSELAKKWMSDLEMAAKDGEVCERILTRNTRKEAVKAVKMFLKEAWEGLGPSFLEVAAAKHGSEIEALRRGVNVCSDNPRRESMVVEGDQNDQAVKAEVSRKYFLMKLRRRRGAKISDTDDELIDNATDKTNQTDGVKGATAETNRVQEATRSGFGNQDPGNNCVSDSGRAGPTLSSALPAENNRNMAVEQKAPEKLTTPEVDSVQVPEIRESTANDPETTERQENLKDDAQRHETEDGRKRSLMEANGSGQTFEWDDSIENASPPGSPSRPRSPSPKEKKKRKKWTLLEEDTLRAGVQEFGEGKWKHILESYKGIFQDRKGVDLKDKWRNLTK